MIAYHPTKSSWQKVSSSEVVVVRVTVWLYKSSLWPWPWRQQTFFSAWHSGSFCCITIPNLVTKYFMVQKISSWQTFTDIFNLCCDLDLEHSNPIFPQDTLVYDAVLSNQVWLQMDQRFRRYNKKSYFDYISPCCDLDIKHSEITFSAWLSGLLRCITIPGLATKYFLVQKISSGQTFWTFAVTLTLSAVIPFSHVTHRLIIKFGCKRISSLEDIVKIVIFWLYKPLLWPWHSRWWTNFSAWQIAFVIIHHHTKFGKKLIEQFRRYWVDMIRHTTRPTDRHTDKVISIYSLPPKSIRGCMITESW